MDQAKKAEECSFAMRAKTYLKPVLIGTAAGIITTFLLLLLSAAIMAGMHLTLAAVPWLTRVASMAGGFVAGFLAARLRKKRGLLVGGFTGAVVGICALVVGICVCGEFPLAQMATKLLLFVVTGLIGGVLGVSGKHH